MAGEPTAVQEADRSLRELTSGMDALGLSGRGELAPSLVAGLEAGREAAAAKEAPVAFRFGRADFGIHGYGMGKYQYSLVHPNAQIGLTRSDKLPTVRVQLRSEFLHAVGPAAALAWAKAVVWEELEDVTWTVNRLDLFCDVQGWDLNWMDESKFLCRARSRTGYLEGKDLTGFTFGKRKTGTVMCRIYDKTLDVANTGKDWWFEKWGNRYDPAQDVRRIEFEVNRAGLVEFGIDTPEEGLELAPGLWASLTNWLSYRTPTSDLTKSRWPLAPEWEAIQQASLRGDAIGLERVRAGKGTGSLRRITPALVGYLARAGSLIGTDDLDSTLAAVGLVVHDDEIRRGIQFPDRIDRLVQAEAFR